MLDSVELAPPYQAQLYFFFSKFPTFKENFMFKRIISATLVALTLVFSGCAMTPQGYNIATGTVLGGLAGVAIGDNRQSAERGATLGALIGAFAPVQQQQPYQNQGHGYGNNGGPMQQPAPNCPRADGRAIFARSAEECAGFRQQLAQQYQPQQHGRNPFNSNSCPSGARMINGVWRCMDN